MANTIFGTVQGLIDKDLSLQDALQRGYANYSGVARILKPKVEEILGKEVKLESIITSVKRARVGGPIDDVIAKVVAGSIISLRTDVAKLTVEKTRKTLEILRRELTELMGEFFQILGGVGSITLIFDEKIFGEIYKLFNVEDVLDVKRGLAAIIINSPRDIVEAAGCTVSFYNPVARLHISMEETMSCYTDTIIILKMMDAGKAFEALNELIAEARRSIKP
jgi:hypothetical protein